MTHSNPCHSLIYLVRNLPFPEHMIFLLRWNMPLYLPPIKIFIVVLRQESPHIKINCFNAPHRSSLIYKEFHARYFSSLHLRSFNASWTSNSKYRHNHELYSMQVCICTREIFFFFELEHERKISCGHISIWYKRTFEHVVSLLGWDLITRDIIWSSLGSKRNKRK